MKIPLSVIIIVKNEENRLLACVNTVKDWVDEIIIINDESTDRTVEIAKGFTEKVFTRKMELEGKQRNFGVSKAKNDWVMMLDCDERITPELKDEIIETIKRNDSNAGAYWIPKRGYLGKYHLKYGGWGAEHVKIYNKHRCRWREHPYDIVHPGIQVDDPYTSPILKNRMIHYNFANFEDFIKKVNRYTTLEAMKWHISGKKMGLGRAIWRMIDRFFRRYIGKKGYKDGFYGFMAALLSGFYEIAAYAKLTEVKEHGFYLKEYGIENEEAKK